MTSQIAASSLNRRELAQFFGTIAHKRDCELGYITHIACVHIRARLSSVEAFNCTGIDIQKALFEPYTVQSRPGAAIGNIGVTLLVTDRVSAVSTRTMSGLDRSIDSLVIGRRYAGLTVILSRPATTTSSRSLSRSKQPHRDSCVGQRADCAHGNAGVRTHANDDTEVLTHGFRAN